MGLIRLVLTFLVVAVHVHANYPTAGGVAAVQVFFIISGLYMAATFERRYAGRARGRAAFYLNRVLRIWPTYLAMLGVTGLAYGLSGGTAMHDYRIFTVFHGDGSGRDWLAVLLSLSIVGQDFAAVERPLQQMLPIRQSWSIGSEILFYLIVPFIYKNIIVRRCVLAVLGLFLIAKYTAGQKFGFRYSYFLPVFNLGYFLFGCGLYHIARHPRVTAAKARFPWMERLALPLFACAVLGIRDAGFEADWGRHVLFVAAFSGIAVLVFSDRAGAFDTYLGNLSYGVYLGHELVAAIVLGSAAQRGITLSPDVAMILVSVLSLMLSAVVERWIQRPVDGYRRRIA